MKGGVFLSLIGKDTEGIRRISKLNFNCCNVTKKCYHLTVAFFQMICLLPARTSTFFAFA